MHDELVLLLVIKLCFVSDLEPASRITNRHRCLQCRRASRWIQHRILQIRIVVLLLSREYAFRARAQGLRDLERSFRLRHHYIAPLKVLQRLLHAFVGDARFAVAEPAERVSGQLRRGFNQDIFYFNGGVACSVLAAWHWR